MQSRVIPPEVRLWSKVPVRGDGCWEFAGAKSHKGYGQLPIWRDGRSIPRSAHRLSWELANGPIPAGMSVLHRCDNPPCVRPDHLFLGTQSDNMQDMVAKGRAYAGPAPVFHDRRHVLGRAKQRRHKARREVAA